MRMRYYIKTFIAVLLLVGCEGSFSPDEIPMDGTITFINLTVPTNDDVCLTEGLNEDGNWVVRFEWNTDTTFDGSFNLTIFRDGIEESSQTFNSGDELTLLPNTIYQWQVGAVGEDVLSDTATFITPAPRDENGTTPPVLSSIQVVPEGADFNISFSVLDADGDLQQSQLFVDNSSQGNFGQQTSISQSVSLPDGESTIRVVAIDQAGNETTTSRTYTN